ncbi:MAG TPA: hypothetical protein VFM97_00115 [Gammaproteobacteria bacterium]|nr:hypothetical protein [Gammaproteobacteria bacterium]
MSILYNVLCTLENAAEEINGILFETHEKGRIAHDVPAEQAERFGKIPGFTVTQQEDGPANPPAATANPTTPPASPEGNAPQVTPIADMNVQEVVVLLKEHPTAWPDVEAAEAQRDKPRKLVVEAIVAAQKAAEPQGHNPPPAGD